MKKIHFFWWEHGYRTSMDYNQEIIKIDLKYSILYCYCFEGIVFWGVAGCKYILSVGRTIEIFQAHPLIRLVRNKLRCNLPQIMYTFVNESCSWDLNYLQIHIPPFSIPSLKYLSSFWKSYFTKMSFFWNLLCTSLNSLSFRHSKCFSRLLVLCVNFYYSTHHTAFAQFSCQ